MVLKAQEGILLIVIMDRTLSYDRNFKRYMRKSKHNANFEAKRLVMNPGLKMIYMMNIDSIVCIPLFFSIIAFSFNHLYQNSKNQQTRRLMGLLMIINRATSVKERQNKLQSNQKERHRYKSMRILLYLLLLRSRTVLKIWTALNR